ncbi:MAG: Lrp/AsnC family transcriptional regulator [Azonexus sp.]|nr:Lrp/AsnC family transcriptional regulator [Azonexus sp.]
MNETLDFSLLDAFQRDFPLTSRPYAELAQRLGSEESVVMARLEAMRADGRISRIGAVLPPGRFGVSTLVAMAIPAERLDEAAAIINTFPGVNHNYERTHHFNLWFVLTAGTQQALVRTLACIEQAVETTALALPLEKAYHIDLGFSLDNRGDQPRRSGPPPAFAPLRPMQASERYLLRALQNGLTICERPYAELAAACGLDEATVIERLTAWVADGSIKRLGVIVRHRELGFDANAMLVHDIADDRVDDIAQALAGESAVTLCYRRPRRGARWPFNLFCMIHGQCRTAVLGEIAALRHRHGLADVPHSVLFSERCFKQMGARYV